MEVPRTINAKPAAGVFGAYVTTLVVSLLHRYAGYDPTIEEVGALVGIFGFVTAWLVPERWWGRATEESV
jgi:hypothetical protein